jgi:hypothetical protein
MKLVRDQIHYNPSGVIESDHATNFMSYPIDTHKMNITRYFLNISVWIFRVKIAWYVSAICYLFNSNFLCAVSDFFSSQKTKVRLKVNHSIFHVTRFSIGWNIGWILYHLSHSANLGWFHRLHQTSAVWQYLICVSALHLWYGCRCYRSIASLPPP